MPDASASRPSSSPRDDDQRTDGEQRAGDDSRAGGAERLPDGLQRHDDQPSAHGLDPLPGPVADEGIDEGVGGGAGEVNGESASQVARDLVGEAMARWTDQLARLVGDDPLLHFRDQRDGTLDLTHAHPSGLAMLLAGRPCRLSALVREPGALSDARRRARAVQGRATALAEERGLDAGWLAVGLATWQVPDDERAPAAPVLLRSCRLRPRGAAGDDIDLDLGGRIVLNPALVAEMARRGVHLDGDVVADLALRDDGFDPTPVLERVLQTCRGVPGFAVDRRYVIGTFVTAWRALLDDLADPAAFAGHDVLAALAGDREAVARVGDCPAPEALADAARDVDAHLVLDADADQERALTQVVAGSHLVLDAPPGTGASQTIANLVAVLSAAGRRVLVVSPKRAALDSVLSRLDALGLGDLVLDLPDAGADRRRVLRDLARTLDRAGGVPQPEPDPLAARRDELRQRLDDHVQALHEQREPWGSSAYDAQLALAELTARRPAPRSRVRVRGEDLHRLDQEGLAEIGDRLREAAELGVFQSSPDDDPWFGARLATTEEADEAHARVTRLAERSLPEARDRMTALLAEVGMPPARNVADWDRALTLLGDVRATLDVFSAKVYDTSLADVVAATGSADWRAEHGVRMGALQRRKVRRHARSLLRPGRPPADLHEALVRAAEQRARWQEQAGRGAVPRLPSGLAAAETAYAAVHEDLGWLAERLWDTPAGADLLTDDLQALGGRLDLLAGRTTSLPLVPTVVALRDRLAAAGLAPLLDDLAQRHVPAQDVRAELDLVWWTSLLQHVARSDPRYGQHDGDELRRAAQEFAQADRAHLAAAAQRVRRTTAGRLVRTLDRHGDQADLVRSEAARDRRWQPLREMVRLAPDVLAAARPCWLASPLVVPQVLPADARFDVVVVDAASQATVAETVAALSRGRQVVVVGDLEQAGPSATMVPAGRPGGRSVLESLRALLPVVELRTAHGALNERVAGFAAGHAYRGALRVLPVASSAGELSLQVVEGTGVLVPGQDAVESTDAEVQRVVELVVEHVRTRPEESLGVVTLSAAHAERVESALRLELSHHPRAAAFAGADMLERFFVKVADRAQGDTRDAVILSVGFGRTPHGRVLHRFGAVSEDDGERFLLSALTRARRRMTVVAAFGPDDLDEDRLTSPGARLLQALLAHAATEPFAAVPARGRTDLLLGDLARRLREEELEVAEGYGWGDQLIDLAVGDRGAGWVVAAESDGPGYAGAAARERDRLRPEALARRGWVHDRVWSTDVFRDPAREVARLRGAVREEQRRRERAGDGSPGARASATGSPDAGVRWDSPGRSAVPGSAAGTGTGTVAGSAAGAVTGAAAAGSVAGSGGSPWTAVAPSRRGERPRVPTGRPIEQYRESELDAVVTWICSDTLLRTRDQIAALVRQQLGFVRRSSRVDAVVSAAIERVVARGEVRTADEQRPVAEPPTASGRRSPGSGVQAHDPHERWLLDQRPPHWD